MKFASPLNLFSALFSIFFAGSLPTNSLADTPDIINEYTANVLNSGDRQQSVEACAQEISRIEGVTVLSIEVMNMEITFSSPGESAYLVSEIPCVKFVLVTAPSTRVGN